jgi:hypothetical protein
MGSLIACFVVPLPYFLGFHHNSKLEVQHVNNRLGGCPCIEYSFAGQRKHVSTDTKVKDYSCDFVPLSGLSEDPDFEKVGVCSLNPHSRIRVISGCLTFLEWQYCSSLLKFLSLGVGIFCAWHGWVKNFYAHLVVMAMVIYHSLLNTSLVSGADGTARKGGGEVDASGMYGILDFELQMRKLLKLSLNIVEYKVHNLIQNP